MSGSKPLRCSSTTTSWENWMGGVGVAANP